MVIANKLKRGANVRVVSPALSLQIISEETRSIANKNFSDLGLKVSFAKNSEEKDDANSSTVNSRLNDIHEAFSNKEVEGIITSIGGFNSNQLLQYLDYKLIKKNPKAFCGFSDITALLNAIYAKTGIVTYLGPHYSTFGIKKGNE